VSAVRNRLAAYPVMCPRCKQLINRGELIATVKIGTTETSACYDCAFDNDEPLLREGNAS
jgi:hypothetical protein